MVFQEILDFRVQITRKYIMVVNVPLHCSEASPPFPYNKPGSLTNYMRRWWPKTFYSPSLISSVTQSYTNPVKWQTSACKRVAAAAAPLPSTMYACLPVSLPASLTSASATACLLAWLLCCLFLFFSLALYVTVLFEATRIQCNDDDDGNETTLSAACGGAAAVWRSTPPPPRRSFSSSMRDESTRCS